MIVPSRSVAAAALLGSQSVHLLKAPPLVVRSLIAGLLFTLFMQAFHLPVGPSELHFLGAMPLYLALGFVPGETVEVCRNAAHGPLLVGVKGSRVMLGRGMAEKIPARLVNIKPAKKTSCCRLRASFKSLFSASRI